jgi:hypothetical protein
MAVALKGSVIAMHVADVEGCGGCVEILALCLPAVKIRMLHSIRLQREGFHEGLHGGKYGRRGRCGPLRMSSQIVIDR